MTASQKLRDGVAVEFHGVAFSYADAEGNLFEPVLKGVNLSVARGQCVAVTGCSGCGKTTLMRLVNGLAPQAYDGELSGTVRVLGQDAADLGIEGLSLCVGSVFQNPRSQFFNLDTTSEIAFGCENAGLPHDEIHLRVRGAAADLDISHLLDRDIRKLSGGQRQMVALASVHALGPEVFALDEPTAALDVASMRTLAHLVRRLKELGRTVIVSEHRLWWLRGDSRSGGAYGERAHRPRLGGCGIRAPVHARASPDGPAGLVHRGCLRRRRADGQAGSLRSYACSGRRLRCSALVQQPSCGLSSRRRCAARGRRRVRASAYCGFGGRQRRGEVDACALLGRVASRARGTGGVRGVDRCHIADGPAGRSW